MEEGVFCSLEKVDVIDELFPRFNALEVDLTNGLSNDEQKELSRLLRIVITNASPDDDA